MKNSNKKKKLHFLFGDPLESFYQAIAIYLSRHYGFTEFSGLMWGHNQLRLLDRQKVNWTHIEVISDHIRTTLPSVKLDTNYLKEIEQKYGIPNFGLMIHSDRWFGKKPYKWVLKFLQMSVNLIERMYDKTQPDVVIIDPVADLMSYLHYVIAVEKGIPCYSITNSRMPDRISIDSGPYRLWKRVDQFFEEKLHRLSTTSELTKAETFLENFRQKKFRPLMGTQIHSTRDFFKYQYFLSFIRSITNWLMDPYNPVFYRPHQLIITHLSRLIRHAATRLLHYFEKPVSGEKYVLYPLHFEPEESTLIAAPYFVDQLSLIENIARSLPIDCKLYVKEHLVSVGRRPLSYYNRIRCLYNVRLIHPSSDSFQLVQNAAAVATISGTMGWEALLLEKPVITFGQVCYNSYPLVIQARLQPVEKWPEIFLKVLKNNKSNNRELLLKYVSAILDGTFPGIVGNSVALPQILEPENIKKVCDALVTVLKDSEKE